MSRDHGLNMPLRLKTHADGSIAWHGVRTGEAYGRDSRRSYRGTQTQMIRSVIAFNTARVRSRVPSLSRMVDT